MWDWLSELFSDAAGGLDIGDILAGMPEAASYLPDAQGGLWFDTDTGLFMTAEDLAAMQVPQHIELPPSAISNSTSDYLRSLEGGMSPEEWSSTADPMSIATGGGLNWRGLGDLTRMLSGLGGAGASSIGRAISPIATGGIGGLSSGNASAPLGYAGQGGSAIIDYNPVPPQTVPGLPGLSSTRGGFVPLSAPATVGMPQIASPPQFQPMMVGLGGQPAPAPPSSPLARLTGLQRLMAEV